MDGRTHWDILPLIYFFEYYLFRGGKDIFFQTFFYHMYFLLLSMVLRVLIYSLYDIPLKKKHDIKGRKCNEIHRLFIISVAFVKISLAVRMTDIIIVWI